MQQQMAFESNSLTLRELPQIQLIYQKRSACRHEDTVVVAGDGRCVCCACGIYFEGIAVVAVQAVVGAEPHEPLAILIDAFDEVL